MTRLQAIVNAATLWVARDHNSRAEMWRAWSQCRFDPASRTNASGRRLSWRPASKPSNPVTYEGLSMSQPTPLAVEEHVHGETVWVALRARGAEWSWLTPDEALRLGRE